MYASDLELRFFKEVIEPSLENGTYISCTRQVKYELLPSFIHKGKKHNGIYYVSDFNVIDKDGHEIVIDTKGFLKPIDVIKHKLLLYRNPDIDFRLIGHSIIDGGFVDYSIIQKGRNQRKKEKDKNKKLKGESHNG